MILTGLLRVECHQYMHCRKGLREYCGIRIVIDYAMKHKIHYISTLLIEFLKYIVRYLQIAYL